MNSSWFDDLTKALATSTTRRQALRRIAGIVGGTALAGLFPGLALANNSACAHFCNMVFGEGTPAQSQCASDAAHHRGLCYTCGPASSGGTKPICCPQNPDGTCTSYSSATCCSDGQICQGGTCVTPTTTTAPPTTTTTPAPTTTTTTTPAPQYQPHCVCANGATITGGAPCSDLPMCESVFAPGTCQALCFPAGGVTSATCVLC